MNEYARSRYNIFFACNQRKINTHTHKLVWTRREKKKGLNHVICPKCEWKRERDCEWWALNALVSRTFHRDQCKYGNGYCEDDNDGVIQRCCCCCELSTYDTIFYEFLILCITQNGISSAFIFLFFVNVRR